MGTHHTHSIDLYTSADRLSEVSNLFRGRKERAKSTTSGFCIHTNICAAPPTATVHAERSIPARFKIAETRKAGAGTHLLWFLAVPLDFPLRKSQNKNATGLGVPIAHVTGVLSQNKKAKSNTITLRGVGSGFAVLFFLWRLVAFAIGEAFALFFTRNITCVCCIHAGVYTDLGRSSHRARHRGGPVPHIQQIVSPEPCSENKCVPRATRGRVLLQVCAGVKAGEPKTHAHTNANKRVEKNERENEQVHSRASLRKTTSSMK